MGAMGIYGEALWLGACEAGGGVEEGEEEDYEGGDGDADEAGDEEAGDAGDEGYR